MFHLHRALHRREEFPPFVQGKLFGMMILLFLLLTTDVAVAFVPVALVL